jgi:hypothetical protein
VNFANSPESSHGFSFDRPLNPLNESLIARGGTFMFPEFRKRGNVVEGPILLQIAARDNALKADFDKPTKTSQL